ncbi:MAG: hypothetical protein V3S55_04580, partial [Nitrospiraceae bacterium]
MPPFPVDPKKDTICDVIRRWADVQPDAPAFIAENTAALSYGDLVGVMEGLRHPVWSAGLGRGDRIAIALPSGPNLAAV